jgi:nucleoside diphosphate kinase
MSAVRFERSVYIIKPEAQAHKAEIESTIQHEALVIEGRCSLRLTVKMIEALYPDVRGDLLQASIHFLTRGPSHIGVVSGAGAISKLFNLAGTSVNPAACSSQSLRYRFGNRTPERFGSAVYFLNAIHRSVDQDEAKRDQILFGPYLT